MRQLCNKYLKYITDAIDKNASDYEINKRIEKIANKEDITTQEYCEIYDKAMQAYNKKFGII